VGGRRVIERQRNQSLFLWTGSKWYLCSPGANSSRTTARPIGFGDGLDAVHPAVFIMSQVLLMEFLFHCVLWILASVMTKCRAWARMVV